MVNQNFSKSYFLRKIYHNLNLNNGSIKRKRITAISLLIEDFIKTVNRLNSSPTESMTKMYTSILKGILDNLIFTIEKNPIFKDDSLNHDKQRILTLLKSKDRKLENIELRETYNSLLNLRRKLNRLNMIELHCNTILYNSITFGEVDILVDSLISELIHFGYSTQYLFEWFKNIDNTETADIDNEIIKINSLSFEMKKYCIALNMWLPSDIKQDDHFFCGLEVKIVTEEEIKEFLSSTSLFDEYTTPKVFNFCVTEVQAPDKYRAIEQVVEEIQSYIGLFSAYETPPQKIILDNGMIKENDAPYEKISTNIRKLTQDLVNSYDERFKKDVRDFIKLRSNHSETPKRAVDIIPIERTLNVLIRSRNLNPENRLLNTWSSLEYILSSYPKNSIIEKVRTIIPKTIALYIIKDKLNTLWDELKNYKNKHASIRDVIASVSIDGKSFDKIELITFISNVYCDTLFDTFVEEMKESNVYIYRLVCDLNSLINSPKKYIDAVNFEHESIMHDINTIYRIRNEIAHSSNNIKFDIDIMTARLTFYISCLLGTFIHFQNYHYENTNEGVLYSIVETYNAFDDEFKSTEKGKLKYRELETIDIISRLAFPKYLYL